jgi:hypothetical protein
MLLVAVLIELTSHCSLVRPLKQGDRSHVRPDHLQSALIEALPGAVARKTLY